MQGKQLQSSDGMMDPTLRAQEMLNVRQSLWNKYDQGAGGQGFSTLTSSYAHNAAVNDEFLKKPISRGDGILKLFMGPEHREKIKKIYA